MEVIYVPGVWQWLSILRSPADASRAVDMGHPEGTLPTEGEFVGTLPREHPLKH
jgi:hypothetical protein